MKILAPPRITGNFNIIKRSKITFRVVSNIAPAQVPNTGLSGKLVIQVNMPSSKDSVWLRYALSLIHHLVKLMLVWSHQYQRLYGLNYFHFGVHFVGRMLDASQCSWRASCNIATPMRHASRHTCHL